MKKQKKNIIITIMMIIIIDCNCNNMNNSYSGIEEKTNFSKKQLLTGFEVNKNNAFPK